MDVHEAPKLMHFERGFHSGHQSVGDLTSSLSKLQLHTVPGHQSLSACNKIRRSRPPPSLSQECVSSPQLVECQEIENSPQSTTDVATQERVQGSELQKGSFDIFCKTTRVVKLNKSLYVLNKGRRKELERARNESGPKYLRPGMVLLKNYINHDNQVKILNKCRDLGIGTGGFYRPGYGDEAKLHLQMMCLGKDWDPQLRKYSELRIFDKSVPPEIPDEFRKLVDGALLDARNFLKQRRKSVEDIPNMSPDICIVNYYTKNGKLGLHQDRDESKESLAKGLPVVSFSIGDSAEFLYSDERDGKVEKVILDSGDVLIFGGRSRHIFHEVASIKSDTTPAFLTHETKFRPGRLNLTFRQY